MGLPAGLSSCPKAKMTKEWLWRNVTTFISAKDWPSESPDLNPQDCKWWAVLEDMACRKRHKSLESLRRSLVKAVIPLEMEHAATAAWPERLKACVEAEGGHFERHNYKLKPKTIANKLFGSKSGCFV